MTITVTHTEGPLAGQEHTFDDSFDSVLFGRDREVAQVVYPPEYDVVGRRHFELRRTPAGDYTVELFGSRYVEMDGKPVDNGTPVMSGSTFRLGRKDGPAFEVEVGAPSVQDLPVTADQSKMVTSTQQLGRKVAIGGSVFALVIAGVIGYFAYLHTTLADQLEMARAEAAERAKKEFRQADLDRLAAAVYLVAHEEGGTAKAVGTAWAFDADKLATNAHVTNAIKDHEGEFFLIAPSKPEDGEATEIKIASVDSHPGYDAFKSYKTTQGTTRWGEFTPLDLINEYDVGIIHIDPLTPLPVDAEACKSDPGACRPATLEPASQADLEKLKPGTPVASIGFPVEGLAGGDTATKAPGTLHFGHISALTDVFMVRADPEHRLLIQHSVPVTGGASGSPLIDTSGKVIGIVNGGNTTVFKDRGEAMNAKVRVPSAALINFAQRADMLEELDAGEAAQELAKDETYWDTVAEAFDDYFDVALQDFVKLARSRYNVSDAKEELLEKKGDLPGGGDSFKLASETYEYDVEPGKVYGFIADAESGVPIGINVKNKATSEFVRDSKDPRQTSELELAPIAWVTVTEPTTLEVTVWSFIAKPAKYELYAYEWAKPQPSAAAGP